MAKKVKAAPEQLEALEGALEAHGIRPHDPTHPMRERPRDALRDALANGLGIGGSAEAKGFLAHFCGVSQRTAHEWLKDSRTMTRDAVARALDALTDAIRDAPMADGPYAEEIEKAEEEDAHLRGLYPGWLFSQQERAAQYAFELLFLGMAEADRSKLLRIEAMHAVYHLRDDSLEALLDLLKSLNVSASPFMGYGVRDAERPGHEEQAAGWANDVLMEAEKLKEWADRRHKEPAVPMPF